MFFKKTLVLLLLSSLLIAGTLALTKDPKNALAEEISNRCLNDSRELCLETEILKEVNKNYEITNVLFEQFANLLKAGELNDDPRIFSPIIHDVGMELAFKKIEPALAFTYCGEHFKAGCLHGFVMESLDVMETSDTQVLLAFCEFTKDNEVKYANCIHGVGHELVAKQTDSLELILEECKKTELPYVQACTSGVFMEFSTGVHGTGTHTHTSPIGSIDLPCQDVSNEFKSVCYISSSAYRQYLPTTETFQETSEKCGAVPESYQDDCFLGLAEKIFTASAEDIQDSYQVCETVELPFQELCKHSVDQIEVLEFVL